MDLDRKTLLGGLIVVLLVVGVVTFVAGRMLVSGVLFLALSLSIYFREKEA